MSLRELFNTDLAMNPRGCRASKWVEAFDGDDQDFLYELFESPTPTDTILSWIRRKDLPIIGKQSVNDHRRGRCTCAENTRGRMS